MKHYTPITIGVVAIVASMILFGAFWYTNRSTEPDQQTACTMEAKRCPDGSYVGRTGPACTFAPCPTPTDSSPPTTTDDVASWLPLSDTEEHIRIQYPKELETTYIHAVDWPPTLQTLEEPFVCSEGGNEVAGAGETVRIDASEKTYCKTTVAEGAAGSVYKQFTYSFAHEGVVSYVRFSLRFVQCQNYDEPQQQACTQEETHFDPDALVAEMIEAGLEAMQQG